LLCLAALAIALCGCQTTSDFGNENSPYYVVPAGSRLILERELTIPPEQLAVYVQDGRVLRSGEVRHDRPFCKFELHRLAPNARTVSPDDIVVVRASQQIHSNPVARGEPVLVADNAFGDMVESLVAPPIHSFATRMDLRSEKQPDIFRLTCAQWGERRFGRHVTISEMRRTLAGVFTLRLPHEQPGAIERK
jgi:hypothetical protein